MKGRPISAMQHARSNSPAYLTGVLNALLADGNTVADYRADTGITGTLNASSWANNIGAAGPLLQATAANQPIVLPFSGEKYIYLPAAASNTLTSPTKAITGNQSITLDVALNDYTPVADVTLFDKTSGNNGIAIKWLTTDKLRLVIGDGASLTNVDTSVASSLTDGSRHTITIAWTDGVGASFTIDGVAWGTAVSAEKTLANASATATLGSSTSIGKIYRLIVGSVYDINPTRSAESTTNGATFTASTGETWTLNNTGAKLAQIVGSAQLLFDGSGMDMVAAFTLAQPVSVYMVAMAISKVTSGAYMMDGASHNSLAIDYPYPPTLNFYCGSSLNESTHWGIGAYHVIAAVGNGASSLIAVDGNAPVVGNAGTGTPGGITVGGSASHSSNHYGCEQVKRIIIRNAADSAATRAQIAAYLKSIYGTP